MKMRFLKKSATKIWVLYILQKSEFAKDADELDAALTRQKLEGIYFENESKRFYPQNDIAASIIGFTGVDNTGFIWIELQYENILKGIDGKFTAEKDVFGNIISADEQNYIEPINGKILYSLLMHRYSLSQKKSWRKLQKSITAPKAVAIIMNPNNGEIYAMASYPSFDLNDYSCI
jgi:stage V sporulation protein D (sporulation-specific penicillin-binding protein)